MLKKTNNHFFDRCYSRHKYFLLKLFFLTDSTKLTNHENTKAAKTTIFFNKYFMLTLDFFDHPDLIMTRVEIYFFPCSNLTLKEVNELPA